MQLHYNFLAAFLVGLLGGAHCVGMCGGIMGALTHSVSANNRTTRRLIPLLFVFNLGRILSYTFAGAIVGTATWMIANQFQQATFILRHIAAIMLILLGLYITGWWPVLRYLEIAGGKLWQTVQPRIQSLVPIDNSLQALLAGLLWGWLPCGLVYSSLIWASTASAWYQSAEIMFFFGLGTLPTLMLTGLFLDQLKALMQSKGFRGGAGFLIVLFGLWTLAAIYFQPHDNHSHQGHDKSLIQPIQPATQH